MDDQKRTGNVRKRRSRATPAAEKKAEKPARPRTKAAAIAAEMISEREERATPDIMNKTKGKAPENAVRQATTPPEPPTSPAATAEAVGDSDGGAAPEAVQDAAEQPSEDAVQPAAAPSEPPTSPAAEAVGERDNGAASETLQDAPEQAREDVQLMAIPAEPCTGGADNDMPAARHQGRRAAQIIFRQFGRQSFLTGLTGIALGYILALLIHGGR